MPKILTPREVASRRKSLEAQLSELDDHEQTWDMLTAVQRVVEIIHSEECKKKHYKWEDGYCHFEESSWDATPLHRDKQSYVDRIDKLTNVLPDDFTEEQILSVWKALK